MSLKKITLDSIKSDKGTVNFKNDFSVQVKTNDSGTGFIFSNEELYIMFSAKNEEEGRTELCDNIIDSIQNYYDVPASKLRSTMAKDINSALKKYIQNYEIL
jgi:hypothetical protein